MVLIHPRGPLTFHAHTHTHTYEQQRREKDEQRLLELRTNVAKLDKALTAEIKRGLERNRSLQAVRACVDPRVCPMIHPRRPTLL